MAYFNDVDQSVLFATSMTRYCAIIAARGKAAECDAKEYGNLHDVGVKEADLPHEPGFYVWEGEIHGDTGGWCGSEPIDPDVIWEGTIRPATAEDFRAFGIWREEGER